MGVIAQRNNVKTFKECQNSTATKYKEYACKSSPDQLALMSEIEAPLLSNGNPPEINCSPAQYFKVPLEDRSKYEKLVTNNEISSENSSNDESRNVKSEKIRKRRRMKNIPEKLQSVYKNVEIPIVKNFIIERSKTATDANKKNEKEIGVESDDSIGSASDLRVYDDTIESHLNKGDEVSESIVTCGSSAYHAECESMATHEDDCISRVIRAKQKEEVKKKEIFVEDALFVGHQYGEKPLLLDDELDSESEVKEDFSNWRNEKEDLWIKPSSSIDDDVFALAPFNKPKNKVKQNVDQIASVSQTSTENKISTINPIVLCEASQNLNNNTLQLDIPNVKNQSCKPFSNINLNPFLNNDSEEMLSAVVTTISLPAFSTFTVSANIVTTKTCTPKHVQYYTEAHIPINFRNEEIINTSVSTETVDNITCVDSNIKLPSQIDKLSFHYDSAKLQYKDLEKEFAIESKFSDDDFTKKDNFQDTPFESMNQNETCSYVSRRNSTPEFVYKAKKDKKKEKSKYQLIEERTTDDDGPSSKTSKTTKKMSSKSSKKTNPKTKTQRGFSNMSFEDYPSDEGEILNTSTTPFEVLRNPEQEDRKYGSLKRIGNPFS